MKKQQNGNGREGLGRTLLTPQILVVTTLARFGPEGTDTATIVDAIYAEFGLVYSMERLDNVVCRSLSAKSKSQIKLPALVEPGRYDDRHWALTREGRLVAKWYLENPSWRNRLPKSVLGDCVRSGEITVIFGQETRA